MLQFKSSKHPYSILLQGESVNNPPMPLIRDTKGSINIYCPSPIHGRSFVVGKNAQGEYIVSKGNGLSYTNNSFLDFSKIGDDVWGYLPKKNAIRDFQIGNEIKSLGINTNHMEYVLQIDSKIKIGTNYFTPYLLQYTVKCPYRISDFAFLDENQKKIIIEDISTANNNKFKNNYLYVADVLVNNLYILHKNHVMHNALHAQNYTWALELLDFEASRTDNYPYEDYRYEEYVKILSRGEIIQTYEVINYVAWCLKENIDYTLIDDIFAKYGFKLIQK